MSLRVMVVRPGPNYSVQDVCRGWVRALRKLGCNVGDLNYDDRLNFYAVVQVEHPPKSGEYVKAMNDEGAYALAAHSLMGNLYQFMPDIMLVVSGFFVPLRILDLARERGTKVVMLHTESPYEDDIQLERVPHADLNLINDPTNLEKFRALGATYYQHHCWDPEVHVRQPFEKDKASDLFFVGTGYDSRVEFLEKVDWTGINFALAGHWPHAEHLTQYLIHNKLMCMENEETTKWYSSTKMSFNLYRKEGASIDPNHPTDPHNQFEGWSMGPREVELAAQGTFFLRQPRPESDEVFPFLPSFDDPDEFGDLVRHWMQYDDARDTCARAAQVAVADRTFEVAAKRMLTFFDA